MPRRPNPSHPTRLRLIETVIELAKTQSIESITSDQVLETSGISKGSLYHHFEDFEDLVGMAAVRIYAAGVDMSNAAVQTMFKTCKSAAEFHNAIDALTIDSQAPGRRVFRMNRVHLIAYATRNERLRKLLAIEQQRLTDAMTGLVRQGQAKGWISPSVDPQVSAVFFQAYTLGRVIDDLVDQKMDSDAWIALIKTITWSILGPVPGKS